MIKIRDLIDDLEKIAVEILLWAFFAPKTLVKIVTDPGWAPGYVAKELAEDKNERFDDYISPFILLLLTSLVPYILSSSMSPPGVRLDGPEDGLINRTYNFTANADFGWTGGEMKSTFRWEDYEAPSFKPGSYPPIVWQEHQENDKSSSFGDKFSDTVEFSWDTPGVKMIQVTAWNDRHEEYSSDPVAIVITEPAAPGTGGQMPVENSGESSTSAQQQSPFEFINKFQEESSIFLALAFLGLPLLCALLIEGFRGEPITGRLLKRMFYIQCYYFSPLYLLIFGGSAVFQFFSESKIDTLFGESLTYSVLGLFVWFLLVQANTVAQARGLRYFYALMIVLSLMTMAVVVPFSIDYINQGDLRLLIIGAVGITPTAVLLIALWRQSSSTFSKFRARTLISDRNGRDEPRD